MSFKSQHITLMGKKNIRVKALIDTGADYSYMKKSLAKKLGILLMPTQYYRAGVEKRKGWKALVSIKIGNSIVPTSVIVVPDKDIDKPLVIGVNLLQQRGVELDFRTEKIKLANMYKIRRHRL